MGIFRSVTIMAVMAVWIGIQASPVQAACNRFPLLSPLIAIWAQAQADGGMTTQQAEDIRCVIGASDFGDMLQRLAVAERSGSSGQAMAFVSDMSRLASVALADQPTGVRAILEDSDMIGRVQHLSKALGPACSDAKGSGHSSGAAGGSARQASQGGSLQNTDPASASGVTQGVDPNKRLTDVAGGRRVPARNDEQDVLALGFVVGFLVMLCATVVIVHMSMLMLRALRRYRKICEVPATLTVSILDISGTIHTAGRHGCAFWPDQELEEDTLSMLSMGTFCQIEVAGKTIYAKLLYDVTHFISLRFSDPLEVSDLKVIFSHSLSPPKFDLTGSGSSPKRRWSFGEGRMMRV